MLTILMETHDSETRLAQSLAALVSGAVEGLISDVIILDHGSRDASQRVADAAGARFLTEWAMTDVVRSARGTWLLLLEPGARPLGRWVEEVAEHMAIGRGPARFSASRRHRRPLLARLASRRPALEQGFLVSRPQAAGMVRSGMTIADFVTRRGVHRLSSELMPAWAASR
ncbi:glycosyl transferase [Rhizobium sp. Leaf384]|uniref:hypothetical protein n=1 Tax=unclassified Rhizobium TaxID=2613769 RepID=UPI000713BB27|nr:MULTISPECIES: hypothetical protein [unclassified Rhizobium]KQS77334.1 glycosyl transferase [Rhizobium sp. Leaf383]KQS80757.1 glycosyl transferase [Rhizobium sp. Leaf384]